MLKVDILENGDLRLSVYQDCLDDFEAYKEKSDLALLVDGLEDSWTNGGYHPFDAGEGNPFVGLTSAPCIAESMSFDDHGNMEIEGNFWYHNEYMIYSVWEKLNEQGECIFTLAR